MPDGTAQYRTNGWEPASGRARLSPACRMVRRRRVAPVVVLRPSSGQPLPERFGVTTAEELRGPALHIADRHGKQGFTESRFEKP